MTCLGDGLPAHMPSAVSSTLLTQNWNFASVPAWTRLNGSTVSSKTDWDFLKGNFKLQLSSTRDLVLGTEITGTVTGALHARDPSMVISTAELASSPEKLLGLVSADGSLTFQVGALHLQTMPGQGTLLVKRRGGHLDLKGKNQFTDEQYSCRIYTVIAADETMGWTDPYDQFIALLMGTHARLGAASPVSWLNTLCLRNIFAFVKRAPQWKDLEKEVESKLLWRCDNGLSAKLLVDQYQAFLDLKVERQDWLSTELSPPMMEYGGLRLIDEVWHLHIAMGCYEEDCKLLSKGYVITHQPILGDALTERWRHTHNLHLQRCQRKGIKLDARCWPNPDAAFHTSAFNSRWLADGCG